MSVLFFFQAEDGIRDLVRSRGLGDVYKRQLQRYTGNFVLALDADNAGQQATIRGLNQARQALVRVRKPVVTPGGRVQLEERLGANLFITTLPEGRDPDDVIRQDSPCLLYPSDAADERSRVDLGGPRTIKKKKIHGRKIYNSNIT